MFDFGNIPIKDRRTTKNERRTMKNGEESPRNRLRKRLESVMKAPRLGFFSRKQFFSLISRDFSIPERLNIFALPSFPYLQEKRGRWLPPSSPRQVGLLPQKVSPSIGTPWKAHVGLVAICTPFFTKYTHCAFLLIPFSKRYGTLRIT